MTRIRSTFDDVWRGRRIENHPRLGTQFADALQRTIKMWSAFRMDADDIRPRGREGLKIGIHWRDHQVDVEGQADMGLKCLHHIRTDGDVGHEMAVHDINMQPVGTCDFQCPCFFAKPRKIGSQQ